ncbi:MAG: hypothetical protein R3B70_38505 [Polyangiaceae bacterium]
MSTEQDGKAINDSPPPGVWRDRTWPILMVVVGVTAAYLYNFLFGSRLVLSAIALGTCALIYSIAALRYTHKTRHGADPANREPTRVVSRVWFSVLFVFAAVTFLASTFEGNKKTLNEPEPPQPAPPIPDDDKPPDNRADELTSKLTLMERVSHLAGVSDAARLSLLEKIKNWTSGLVTHKQDGLEVSVAPDSGVAVVTSTSGENGDGSTTGEIYLPGVVPHRFFIGHSSEIRFDHGQSGLTSPQWKGAVHSVTLLLEDAHRRGKVGKLLLVGHHDVSGPDKENYQLALRRATTIKDLIEKSGVAKNYKLESGTIEVVGQFNGLLNKSMEYMFAPTAEIRRSAKDGTEDLVKYHDVMSRHFGLSEADFGAAANSFYSDVIVPLDRLNEALVSGGVSREEMTVYKELVFGRGVVTAQQVFECRQRCTLKRKDAHGFDCTVSTPDSAPEGCTEEKNKRRFSPFRTVVLVIAFETP